MGQNDSRSEGAVNCQIEKAEVGQFKRDSEKWVFEEDVIDVFDDDEVENIIKASVPDINKEKRKLESQKRKERRKNARLNALRERQSHPKMLQSLENLQGNNTRSMSITSSLEDSVKILTDSKC